MITILCVSKTYKKIDLIFQAQEEKPVAREWSVDTSIII